VLGQARKKGRERLGQALGYTSDETRCPAKAELERFEKWLRLITRAGSLDSPKILADELVV
jgi:hypothetical protein